MVEGGRQAPAWDAGHLGAAESAAHNSIGGKGSYLDQFKALMIRNLTIKLRDKRRTLTEFLMPLYCIMILAIIRVPIKDTVFEPIETPHGQASLMGSLRYLAGATIHVAPHTPKVKDVMNVVTNMSAGYTSIPLAVKYYPSEQNLTDTFRFNISSMSVAVVFSEDPLSNKSYTVRFNPAAVITLPLGNQLYNGEEKCRLKDPDPAFGLQLAGCPPNGYFFTGFSALQSLIDTAITHLDTSVEVKPPDILLQNFPKGRYESKGGMALRNIVPLYMVFAWAQFILYMMMLVVDEKEKKIKESMKMMGLRDSVYWLSWFSVYAAYVVVLAVLCVIVLPVARVFLHANLFLMFLLFVLYGFSSIMFGFMLTPFFNKAKVAGIVGNLIQVSFSLLFYLQVYLEDQLDPRVFWSLALISPCAFSFAVDKMILFDYSSGGLSYSKLWEGKGLPFAGSLIMITIDIFLYLFLAYYLDNVVPSEYGTKRKPWFIFQRSFWVQRHKRIFEFSSLSEDHNSAVEITDLPANPDVEPVSAELQRKAAVCIRHLKKIFTTGKEPVNAVDGFSLDIYEDQITAILGHNGAGKSTLFNILTGMTQPTEGSATIFGMDVRDINDLTEIRRITGICPQHDVIFLTLTPREHLSFFARIRGVPSEKIEREVEQTLKDVFLQGKGNTKAADLSGGQKRKLSIGIALIGDPKIIFLDEPTAGVDAYSRRKLWTLLKSKKEGKVILLTTHFMDEADILSDRKAVMSRGKLRCCGTSLFLKNKFGLGYHLTLVVHEEAESKVIDETLREVIPDVQLARFYGKEMSFILPSDSSPQFPSLFKQLDKIITKTEGNVGIEGYGISMTTLEEVFLRLSDENEGGDLQDVDNLGHHIIQERSPSSSPLHTPSADNQQLHTTGNTGFTIESVDVKRETWRAFVALLKMRAIGIMREPAAVILLILLPLGFVVASIALASNQTIQITTDTLLHFNASMYMSRSHPPGALLHNGTKKPLTSLVSTLSSAFNGRVDLYSGSYSDIVKEEYYMGAFDVTSFPSTAGESAVKLTLGFNDSYMHVIPLLVNILNNAILSNSGGGDAYISASTQFLPSIIDSLSFDVAAYLAPLMIGFTFTMIPAGLAVDLVYDREIKARNMLRLNGVGFHLYFSSFLTLMVALYMVSYIGLLIIITAFGVKSLTIPAAFGIVAIMYFLFMPCALLSSAVMCYIFDKHETARQFYPSIVTTLGMVTFTAVSVVDMLVESGDINPAFILHIVLSILFPFYIPFGLMYYIVKVSTMCSLTSTCILDDYMTKEIITMFVVILLDIPLYYLLLRVADTVKLGGSWRSALWMESNKKPGALTPRGEAGVVTPAGEDEDVRQVRDRVAAALTEHPPSPVLIYDLGKVYKKGVDEKRNICKKKEANEFTALTSVSLEVKSGQVFGLLGPNGAGKTTSLRIMTAEEQASRGTVQICGEDILSSMSAVFETMGYCPQHDALWKNITVAEHIECYAEVGGVRKDQVKCLVDTYLKGLEIEEHKNKKSKDCSGGTKRKLSYILSMLGRPQVVLLDEPSTGMDPKSKRFLWNSILSSFKGERSAILTTHSMEEADALCSTIGILVRGTMRCIGPIQHLKNKYGGGYSLEMKVRQTRNIPSALSSDFGAANSSSPAGKASLITQVQRKIKETFPNSILDEQFDERLIYKVPQTDVTSLALIFEMLENAKSEGLVDEYALSQTSLEQVFLQFARQQEDEEEEEEEEEEQQEERSLHPHHHSQEMYH